MARRLPHCLRRAGWLALVVAAFAGCSGAPAPGTATPAHQPDAASPTEARTIADSDLQRAVYITEEALPPRLPVALLEPPIPNRAIDLIVAFEVGDPAQYQAKYRHPIWPGAQSGVTVGVGYDLGHRAPSVIAIDWEAHPHHLRLVTASGVIGPLARDAARRLADVAIEWDLAREVFDQTSVIEHYRVARRVFAPGFATAPAVVQGALVSVVFNRGGSMVGARRAEMRAIRDECLPRADRACVAAQLRAMKRLWAGTDIERGMSRRREAEAQLAEAG